MIKKVVLWGIVAGFIGLLIYGAANRAAIMQSDADRSSGQGRQERISGIAATHTPGAVSGQVQAGATATVGVESGSQTASSPDALDAVEMSGTTQGQNRGQGNGPGQGRSSLPQPVDEWVSRELTVTNVDDSRLTLTGEDGETLVITGRAWRFALEQGFQVQVGDRLQISGYYQAGDFKPGRLRNGDGEQTVTFRDDSGRPVWAGQGLRE